MGDPAYHGDGQARATGAIHLLRVDLTRFVTKLLAMNGVVLYGRQDCEYSAAAKAVLHQHAISFKEIDVGAEPSKVAEMIRLANGRDTTPQVFIDGRHVGGYDELRQLADQGGLDRRAQ